MFINAHINGNDLSIVNLTKVLSDAFHCTKDDKRSRIITDDLFDCEIDYNDLEIIFC